MRLRLRDRSQGLGPWLLFASLLVASSGAAYADDLFTPLHVARLRTVISADISPDGAHTAYRVAVPRDVEKGENGPAWVELWVVDEAGKERPFITGKVVVSSVAWTPDGSGISFVAKREGDEKRALYVIPIDGGEARKTFEHETDIGGFSWSPDGKRLAFTATPALDKAVEAEQKKGFDQVVYEEDWRPSQVWVAAIGDEAEPARRLELEGSVSSATWSPAGGRLLVEVSPTPLVDDQYMHRKLHVVDVESGKVTASLGNPGKLGPTAWSPDGRHVAYITGENENDPKEGRLWVSSVEGGAPRDLLPGLMGHVSAIAWASAESVVYVADIGCETFVGMVGVDGSVGLEPQRSEVIVSSLSISKDASAAALVGESPSHPGEVFRYDQDSGEGLTRQTDSNPWLSKLRFAKQEIVRHQARDGLELEGVLIRPLDEEAGKRYPLILTVHGGPEAHMHHGWLTRYSYAGQVAAARGFAVFYPNYRGSTGRGVEFSKTSQADAAGKEFDDLVDAVDHLVASGLVDRARVGITGGSYGGYASAWGATYYSDRFAASVMFVGISNNISKVGTTDIPVEMYKVHHRKWLWEDWQYFLERSPIYHVEKSKTPLLILHGAEDPRVHPSQSLELYRHLKNRGQAPVRLVLYPGEGHGNRKAAGRYDYNLRMMRWFEHYLKGEGGAAPPARIDYGLEKPADDAKESAQPDARESRRL